MKNPVVVIRLGAGKRTMEFAGQTVDLNAADKKTYGSLMRALREGFEREGKR